MRRFSPFFAIVCASACAMPASDPPIDRSALDLEACAPGESYVFEGITPGTPTDYFDLVENGSPGFSRGERCAGASDVDTCEDAFGRLLSPVGWSMFPGGGAPAPQWHLRYTRSDEVAAIGHAELAAFLAPVDSPADAALLAQASTQAGVPCGEPVARATDDGYELVLRRVQTCGGQAEDLRITVTTDGVATTEELIVVTPGREEICP